MDGLTLLHQALAAGLIVTADGGRLKIRGPRQAESVAQELIANKQTVLKALEAATLTRPAALEPPYLADSSMRDWDAQARELIAFFRRARPWLPAWPFPLTRWQFISDPAKWYQSLELDISFGPLGCRARMGVLQEDLRRLREYVLTSKQYLQ